MWIGWPLVRNGKAVQSVNCFGHVTLKSQPRGQAVHGTIPTNTRRRARNTNPSLSHNAQRSHHALNHGVPHTPPPHDHVAPRYTSSDALRANQCMHCLGWTGEVNPSELMAWVAFGCSCFVSVSPFAGRLTHGQHTLVSGVCNEPSSGQSALTTVLVLGILQYVSRILIGS